MRFRGEILSTALVLGAIAGCGGDKTTTVVKTVVTPASPPAQTAPADTVTTETLPSEPVPTEAPPANLPDGAIAVQGRYTMRVVRESASTFVTSEEGGNEGARRAWFAKTTCAAECQVELRRELPNGAYETVTLDPVEGDPTRYATEGRIKKDHCNANPISAATRRISLKASATRDVGGRQIAIRLDGYLVITQRCQIGGPPDLEKWTVQYRGSVGTP